MIITYNPHADYFVEELRRMRKIPDNLFLRVMAVILGIVILVCGIFIFPIGLGYLADNNIVEGVIYGVFGIFALYLGYTMLFRARGRLWLLNKKSGYAFMSKIIAPMKYTLIFSEDTLELSSQDFFSIHWKDIVDVKSYKNYIRLILAQTSYDLILPSTSSIMNDAVILPLDSLTQKECEQLLQVLQERTKQKTTLRSIRNYMLSKTKI